MNDLIDEPVNLIELRARELREQLSLDALKAVLQSRNGRRFIWQLMGRCGFTQNPFAANNDITNFNCGRQSVATDLIVEMDKVNPDAFHLMSKESKEDESYVNGNPSTNPHDSIAALNTSESGNAGS